MAIIKTYPLKNNYYGPDRLLLSDMQPDSEGNVSGDTRNLTLSSLKSFLGANAVLNLTTTGTSGASTYDANTNTLNVPVYEGDTYNLRALQKSGASVPLKLNAASGTDSEVSFTEGNNVTLTRNSDTEITISATGGNAGVSSITNAFGTYISGTNNTAATGAVGLGTINLSAINGTSIATTRFLSKDNTWDVISASGSNNQFQYNNNGAFAGSSMLVLGTDEIVIGDTLSEHGKLRIEGNESVSGNIKIEGTTATKGVNLSVQTAISSDYNVVFPDTGPGGNNKILESDSSGNLAWISTPTGINVVGNPSGTAFTQLSKITIGSTIYAIPTQGLTSVGLSAPPAFSVTGSPLTSNGSISIGVTGGSSGEFLAYNGQWAIPTDTNSTYSLGTGPTPGQIILTGSNPTTSQTITVAGTNGMSITQFTPGTFNVDLGLATSSTRGGVKIGFAESGKNYPVELSSEKMFVNVPWTDTVYTLPEATATVRGGIELFSNTTQTTAANSVTTTANRTYGIQLNAANQAVVNVPWVSGSGGAPGGNAGSVQFKNSSGAFGGSSKFTYTDSTRLLNIGVQDVSGAILNISGGQTGGAGQLRLGDDGTSGGIVTLKAAADISSGDYDIVLPSLAPGSNNKILESNSSGQLSWITTPGATPGGSTGSVQFKNQEGAFAGNSNLLFSGGTLTVGEAGGDGGRVVIEAEDGVGSGILKIGHQNVSNYLNLGLGGGTMSSNYSIEFPVASPGGNNKILESNSSGQLTWITTPTGSSLTAGSGIQIGSGTIQTDNLANGGIIYSGASNELAVNVGASAIIGTLPVARGGTGLSVSTTTNHSTLIGNGDSFVQSGTVNSAMQLPAGNTANRPEESEGNAGLIRYNTQTANFEVCKETSAGSETYSWYTISGLTIISG